MDGNNPGPIDSSVLYEQERHVSAAVWDGQERGALRCHEHTSKLGEWKLIPRQIALVERAGFGYLRRIPAISLDNPLISALVERWRRETNTFHFTVGEMTVTLQDVALLLGLAIDGNPVIGVTHTTCSTVCSQLLGRAPDSNYASGGMVKLSWLKEFFSQLSEDAPEEKVEQCTRAYLLYLVGSTIFSTTTGNKVPVMYLPLFEDFDESGKFAWGAAALAFLYRALGNACIKTQSTICGCLTLLQCWSYFHLNIGRPKLNLEVLPDQFPFVLRWKGKQSGATANRDVIFYRKALDALKAADIEWLPYKYMDSAAIPDDIRKNLVYGRAKTMLICFDKAERHLPDRCLRQYGMPQAIPEDVEKWLRKSRGVDGGVDLSGKMETELNEWHERHIHIVGADDDGDDGEYADWYSKITRKVVGRPISLSSEFQRTIIGLKEIAYMADSFSTKGLDAQQFESISRIRFIAQDCLRDQSANSASLPSPSAELGKRIRGKEKVRKGNGKRKRKDDLLEYQGASDDDALPPFGVVIGVDQPPSRHFVDEDGQFNMPQISYSIDHSQLYLREGDQPGHAHQVNKVDEVLGVEHQVLDASEQLDVVEKMDHPIEGGNLHSSGMIIMDYSTNVIDGGKELQTGDVKSEDCQIHGELNDMQMCKEVNGGIDIFDGVDTESKMLDAQGWDASAINNCEFHSYDAERRNVESYLEAADKGEDLQHRNAGDEGAIKQKNASKGSIGAEEREDGLRVMDGVEMNGARLANGTADVND